MIKPELDIKVTDELKILLICSTIQHANLYINNYSTSDITDTVNCNIDEVLFSLLSSVKEVCAIYGIDTKAKPVRLKLLSILHELSDINSKYLKFFYRLTETCAIVDSYLSLPEYSKERMNLRKVLRARYFDV